MSAYDYKKKGADDFAAGRKDERLFHSGQDNGRLYREGWHAARRALAEPPLPSSSQPTGGTFTFTMGGRTTPPLSYKAKPEEIAAAIEKLSQPPAPVVQAPLTPPDVPTPAPKPREPGKLSPKPTAPGQLDLF